LITLRSGQTLQRPALRVLSMLVRIFPFSVSSIKSLIFSPSIVKKQVTICSSALEACKNAEAVVIATEWKEFKEIDWEAVYKNMNKPAFVFDGRLLVDAEKLRKIGFKVSIYTLDDLFKLILTVNDCLRR
jgi:UDP-N-acetyl-D-mannosaminuronate dehydrogenase